MQVFNSLAAGARRGRLLQDRDILEGRSRAKDGSLKGESQERKEKILFSDEGSVAG